MSNFARALGRVLFITLGGAAAATVATREGHNFLGGVDSRPSPMAVVTLLSLLGCLFLAVPEGLLGRSFRRWLIIAGTAFAGAVTAGSIATLAGEEGEACIVAGALGAGAGYGLGAGIVRKAWLAMIVGLLVGQIGGLIGGQVFVLELLEEASAWKSPFFCAVIILLSVAIAMELVDIYLKRRNAGEAEDRGAGAPSGDPPGQLRTITPGR